MNPPKPTRAAAKQSGAGALAEKLICAAVCLAGCSCNAASTNLLSSSLNSSTLPDAGPSLLRVLGALALVLGLFLGGVWLIRNGRFSVLSQGRKQRLNVLESRSLGGRQSLYVVAYGQERFLIGSTPAGINLLSHLAPPQEGEDPNAAQPASNGSFAQVLVQMLNGPKAADKPAGRS